jgi:hypothetical protein
LEDARRTAPGAGSPAAAAAAGATYLLNCSGDIDTAHRLLCGAVAAQPAPYDPDDATLDEALHVLMLVCFFGGRPDLWAPFDAALAAYPAVPELLAVTRGAFADPARLDAAVAALPHVSDRLHIIRVGIAAAYGPARRMRRGPAPGRGRRAAR